MGFKNGRISYEGEWVWKSLFIVLTAKFSTMSIVPQQEKHSTERLLSSFGIVAQPKDISNLINQNTKYDSLERVFDESLVKQAERVYNELSASNSNLCKAMPS